MFKKRKVEVEMVEKRITSKQHKDLPKCPNLKREQNGCNATNLFLL